MVNILKDKIYNLYLFKKHNTIVVYYWQTKKRKNVFINHKYTPLDTHLRSIKMSI